METTSATAESVTGEPDGPDSAGAGSAAAYRPHLDGLRAVAVYLVVLFHAGSERFPGGYVGVDVFFVLSGYLVTQLLLRDLARTDSIRFGRFYARRFRRLLPAAFVALTVTAVVYSAIAAPAEVTATVGSFKAAFLYSTNWYFIHQATGYFGADITANPVLHFWSLAVEEQFYLLWPLVLGGGFALTRRMDRARRMRVLRIAVTIGAIASAIWALSLRNSDPNRAYYGTDTRAYELLAGALIALAPAFVTTAKRSRAIMRIATTTSVAVLLVVASSWVHFDAIERGIAVTVITCVLIAALEAADRSAIKRILSTPTAVYLGKISYGTYLWHWLVILVVLRTFHISSLSTIAIAALIATALAALSYELLEHPIRTNTLLNRHRAVVIAIGLTVSIISALVLIPNLVDPTSAATPTAQASTTNGFTPVPPNLNWREARNLGTKFTNCFHKPVRECTIVRGTGPHLLLIGDSHARMYIPTFTEIARREHLTLSVAVKGGCPWQRDLYVPISSPGTSTSPAGCAAEKHDVYTRVIPHLHPDLIIAVNFGYEDPNQIVHYLGPNNTRVDFRTTAYKQMVRAATTRSISDFRASSPKVLLIEPIPRSKFDPIICLSKAEVLAQCRYVVKRSPSWLEKFYRSIANRDDGVQSANFDNLVCPFFPICDPIVNKQIVKGDRSHLSIRFARSLAPAVDSYLKQTGLVPQ